MSALERGSAEVALGTPLSGKLRIGILVDGELVPSWFHAILQEIQGSSYATCVLVVRNAAAPYSQPAVTKLIRNQNRLAFILHTKIEKAIFKLRPDPFALLPIRTGLPVDAQWVEVTPIQSKFSDKFTTDDIAKIRSFRIDIFLRLGFRILRGEVLQSAKFGIWSFHHGDNRVNRGGPACAWEVLNRWPTTGCVLQILSEDLDAGTVLSRTNSQTDRLSILRNKQAVYWKGADMACREFQKLHAWGSEKYFADVGKKNDSPEFYSNNLFTTPGNVRMSRALCSVYLRHAARKADQLLRKEQWFLMYGMNRTGAISLSPWRFKAIYPPKDRFWADPHVLFKNGKYYIFIEEFPFSRGKGHISVMTLEENGNWGRPEPILIRDYHLSYPFVFEEGGETFLIPESSENRTIELYRCVEFPHRWDFVMNLMAGVRAVDATLLKIGGAWRLFANFANRDGTSTFDDLFMFSADSLQTNNWRPHPKNPIVSDASRARPAGRFFKFGSELYRPSQNCAERYGYSIRLNRVTHISECEYEEQEVSCLLPNWSKHVCATHTLSIADGITVIDALRKTSKLRVG